MLDNNELTDKLKIWLDKHPDEATPFAAAIGLMAMKNHIASDMQHEYKGRKDEILVLMDSIIDVLHHYSEIYKTGHPDFALNHKQFNRLSKNSIKLDRSIHASGSDAESLATLKRMHTCTTPKKRAFLQSVKKFAENADGSFESVHKKIEGLNSTLKVPEFIQDEFHTMYRNLTGHLNAVKYTPVVDFVSKGFSPDEGPRSAYELLLLYYADAKAHDTWNNTVNTSWFDENDQLTAGMLQNVAKLQIITQLFEMQNDIPRDVVVSRLEKDLLAFKGLGKTHHFSLPNLMGLTRFYVEHNEEKLSAADYAALISGVRKMLLGEIYSQHRKQGSDDINSLDDLSIEVEMLADLYFIEYRKPSPDEVFESAKQAIEKHYVEGRKLGKKHVQALQNIRQERPEKMEEVVLLHYQETEEVRKLRKRLFALEKENFIKDIAENNTSDLFEIGLSEGQIKYMLETGKIPEGTGLTVEHIIDREHGGTNHAHNFILMPESINGQKDRLKKAQINFIPNADKGCWIISWVPEKLPDGTYPKVFKGHLNGDFKIQPDVQPDDQTLTLH